MLTTNKENIRLTLTNRVMLTDISFWLRQFHTTDGFIGLRNFRSWLHERLTDSTATRIN
ncbi:MULTISPECIES: hypothetical protein [unclassified Microcoleus]|uniref:hypothetical protein n=1 Tax=unclassified Microcoleus TaxID=2642155 RepID=UPI002FD2F5A4